MMVTWERVLGLGPASGLHGACCEMYIAKERLWRGGPGGGLLDALASHI